MAMFVAAAPLPPPTAPQSPRFPLTLLLIPIAALSKHGTGITWADLWEATKPPFLSGLLAGAAGLLVKLTLGGSLAQILYLAVGLAVVFGIYAWGAGPLRIPDATFHRSFEDSQRGFRRRPAVL